MLPGVVHFVKVVKGADFRFAFQAAKPDAARLFGLGIK